MTVTCCKNKNAKRVSGHHQDKRIFVTINSTWRCARFENMAGLLIFLAPFTSSRLSWLPAPSRHHTAQCPSKARGPSHTQASLSNVFLSPYHITPASSAHDWREVNILDVQYTASLFCNNSNTPHFGTHRGNRQTLTLATRCVQLHLHACIQAILSFYILDAIKTTSSAIATPKNDHGPTLKRMQPVPRLEKGTCPLAACPSPRV